MWRFAVIALLAAFEAQQVAAVCNQCRDGFTCVSETEFQICFNNQPDTNQTFSCPNEDDICTKYGAICMPRDSGVAPACRGLQNCVCDNAVNYQFVCTSRTTFTMCYNGEYTTTRGVCPSNQICSVEKAANNDYPCDSQCIEEVDNAAICDFIEAVDLPTSETTATDATTISSTSETSTSSIADTSATTDANETTVIISPTPSNTPNELCSNQTLAGRYAIPDDTVCTSYIYCYFDSNQLLGRITPCPNGRYFNRDIRNCQVALPTWCA